MSLGKIALRLVYGEKFGWQGVDVFHFDADGKIKDRLPTHGMDLSCASSANLGDLLVQLLSFNYGYFFNADCSPFFECSYFSGLAPFTYSRMTLNREVLCPSRAHRMSGR